MFKKVSDVPDSELLECVGLWAEDGPVLGIIYHLCVKRRLLWLHGPTGKWDEELAHPLDSVVLRPDLGVRAWMPDGTPVPPQ